MLIKKSPMISVERAEKIIASYGGHFFSWPEQERQAMQNLLKNSSALRELQHEALALDNFMGFSAHEQTRITELQQSRKLKEQILARVPEQKQHKTLSKMVSVNPFCAVVNKWIEPVNIFRPVLFTLSIVLLISGIFSSHYINETPKTETLTLSEFMYLFSDDYSIKYDEVFSATEELEVLAFLEPQILEDDG